MTRKSLSLARALSDVFAAIAPDGGLSERERQLLEGNENVDTDEFMDEILNNQEDPGTRIELRSDKKSPEVKKSVDVLIIHDDDEEEESAGDALIRRK
ncbi:hypothetical protein Tco_0092799 [Tanacetum coccineum]